MKKTIIKGICFVSLLAGLLVLSNAIYTRWFYYDDIVEADAKLIIELDSLQHISDVIYFGESSNTTYSPNDTCSKTISELIQRQAPEVRIGVMQHGAYHAKNYLELIKNIEVGSRVKTIIVTMNLRSFGALWINSALETPLAKATVMYKQYPPIIKRMMLAFGEFDNKTWEERVPIIHDHWKHDKLNVAPDFPHKNTTAWNEWNGHFASDTLLDGKKDIKKIEFTCQFIMIHGFTIDPESNPRIKDFDGIVKVAKEKNLNLVFNLLSENVHYADSLAGPQLSMLIRQNRDLLMKRYNRDGVIVVDNLELVDGKNFIEQDQVTEHYNQIGRLQIATNVVKVAGKYLKPTK